MKSIVAIVLILLTTCLRAQPFGRYGYTDRPHVPGMIVDRGGFAANYPTADRLQFLKPSKEWRPFVTTDMGQTVGLSGGAFLPSKMRFDLSAPGFSAFFPHGMALHLTSTSAPYLSWSEGSVGAKVPTPASRWIVVSFTDNQPALIFGTPNKAASYVVEGRSGDWILRSTDLDGWLRIGLVDGIKPTLANTAESLGQLTLRAEAQIDLFTQMPPKLISTSVEANLQAVTAHWEFDRPGAVVPEAAQMAPIGSYLLQVLCETRSLDAPTEEGPLAVVKGTDLTIRFPAKRVPSGRAVGIGELTHSPLTQAQPDDLPNLVGLAFQNLLSTCNADSRNGAEAAYNSFLSQVPFAEERWTGRKLPYDAQGTRVDLVAAHALLFQSITSTVRPTSEANSLLQSLIWRRDTSSWQIVADDRVVARRAAALAAIAATLCPEPERRLDGAMLQAGLCAEHGLAKWLARRDLGPKEVPMIEPMPSLRKALYSAEVPLDDSTKFVHYLRSPIRAYGQTPVWMTASDTLTWQPASVDQSVLSLASDSDLSLTAKQNLASLSVAQIIGVLTARFKPAGAGSCSATLQRAPWATGVPDAIAIPAYAEPLR